MCVQCHSVIIGAVQRSQQCRLCKSRKNYDVSAAYMCSAPHIGWSNRQAHVVPLSPSIPQVSRWGEENTRRSVASFCCVYPPRSALYTRGDAWRTLKFCLCCHKRCTIGKVVNFTLFFFWVFSVVCMSYGLVCFSQKGKANTLTTVIKSECEA